VLVARSGSRDPSCDDLANDYRAPATRDELARVINDPEQLDLAMKKIERYTADYRQGLRDSCRATRGGAQSAVVGDKRTACLELAKRRAWFVTSGLVQRVDPRPGLATLLDELPDVYACSDPQWLERASPLPVSQADRDALFAAEKDLLEANKVRDDGKLAEATRLIELVTSTAKRLGDRVTVRAINEIGGKDKAPVSVAVEYQLLDRVLLVATPQSNGAFGAEVRFRFLFR